MTAPTGTVLPIDGDPLDNSTASTMTEPTTTDLSRLDVLTKYIDTFVAR